MMVMVTPRASRRVLLGLAIAQLVVVVGIYANHFDNAFHFDDSHSIVENPYLRSLGNVPRFFTDAMTFSSLPTNQSYRPLLQTSFALDYWLAGGLKPFQFHLTSFALFAAQCALMFFLLARLLDRAAPRRGNVYVAWFGAALYSLHTAIAETVNYISARSDLLSTVLVVLAVTLYACAPRTRRWGAHLFAFALAALVKPVVLVFPVLLFLYHVLFESDRMAPPPAVTRSARTLSALIAAAPSAVLALLLALLHSRMTPPSFTPSQTPRFDYLITQPWVILRYFKTFFLPTHLSADTDLAPFTSASDPRFLAGSVFLIAIVALAIWFALRPRTAPIAFGLAWFLITLLPTSSFFPLAEVENDHRMFFPFVGLVIALVAALALALDKAAPWLSAQRWRRILLAAAAVVVLALHGCGTFQRNRVWHDEESLWRDVVAKSPRNGRGLMNYGLTLMAKGKLDDALALFRRAEAFVPYYSYLHTNIGIALAAKGQAGEAEQALRRGVQYAAGSAEPYVALSRFLLQQQRAGEALPIAHQAVAVSASHLEARHQLMTALAATGDSIGARRLAEETLRMWPNDAIAQQIASLPPTKRAGVTQPVASSPARSVDDLINLSLTAFHAGQYEQCVALCQEALRLRPDSAAAFNNICAAYNALKRWDEAAAACREALRLQPGFELARNNLAWAQSHTHAVPTR